MQLILSNQQATRIVSVWFSESENLSNFFFFYINAQCSLKGDINLNNKYTLPGSKLNCTGRAQWHKHILCWKPCAGLSKRFAFVSRMLMDSESYSAGPSYCCLLTLNMSCFLTFQNSQKVNKSIEINVWMLQNIQNVCGLKQQLYLQYAFWCLTECCFHCDTRVSSEKLPIACWAHSPIPQKKCLQYLPKMKHNLLLNQKA